MPIDLYGKGNNNLDLGDKVRENKTEYDSRYGSTLALLQAHAEID